MDISRRPNVLYESNVPFCTGDSRKRFATAIDRPNTGRMAPELTRPLRNDSLHCEGGCGVEGLHFSAKKCSA